MKDQEINKFSFRVGGRHAKTLNQTISEIMGFKSVLLIKSWGTYTGTSPDLTQQGMVLI